jgi:hypothetical protein
MTTLHKPVKVKVLERDIQKVILDWLACEKIFAWRANTGAVAGEYKGKSRFMRFGPKGQSDILGVLPGGRFLAIEVKREGQQATEEQRRFIERVNAVGGVAFVAHSLEECRMKMQGGGI